MKLLVIISFLVSLEAFSSFSPKELNDGIPVSTPSKQNLDINLLEKAYKKARKLPYSHSLLVLRNDQLVAEEYFHGYNYKSPNNLKSVSKSIISALFGLALEKKLIKSVDDHLIKYFQQEYSEIKDKRKNKIKLRHVLSMSTGLNDIDGDSEAWANLNRVKYLLKRPLINKPGKKYSYSTQHTFLLSRLIADTSGQDTLAFANKYLFDPLGIKVLGWPRDALGYYWGGHIFLTSRDMSKFGTLYLNEGKYKGKRIISGSWIKESTSPKIKGSAGNGYYGFHWWSQPDKKPAFYYAWGYGGQYIYIVPEKKLVVVMTNDFESGRPQKEIRNIIEDYIIASAN